MQVEQIDREAAVEYWNGLADEWNSWTEISGQEQDATVQAFARHRHQARAEQAAEIERLKSAWEAQHKEKVAERAEAKLWFTQAQKAMTELDKYKALAETLARELQQIEVDAMEYYNEWRETGCDQKDAIRFAFGLGEETRKALHKYKEARDER